MATAAEFLRAYLLGRGAVAGPNTASGAWGSAVGPLPLKPDNFIALRDTGAWQPGISSHRDGERSEYPMVQIFLRSTSYPVGMDRGGLIQSILDRIGVRPPRGSGPVGVYARGAYAVIKGANIYSPLTYIGQEEQSSRQLFSINVRMTIQVFDGIVDPLFDNILDPAGNLIEEPV